MIHCLIAIFKNTKGYHKNRSYWYQEPIPFVEAAEIGTEKVIKDHSTIGIVVTTDGSIGEIPRSEYLEAEKTVIEELTSIGKPYIVLLNSTHPMLPDTERLAAKMKEEYKVPVLPINIESMQEKDMYGILKEALYEFPILEVNIDIPEWIGILKPNHYVKKAYIDKIKESVIEVDKLRDVDGIISHFNNCQYIKNAYMSLVDPKTGIITITLEAPQELFEKVLNEMIDIDITNKTNLLKIFQEYKETKTEYQELEQALKMVKTTGYGVANPTIKDMKLDKPEITKQGSRYGIKLKATAPSIHMIRVDVESSFEPIIGSEAQSKELIDHLMKDSNNDPNSIWSSEIFGRSLDKIVQEGIQSKISMMPENVRYKFQTTMSKVVNKGSNNLIAIVI